MLIRKKFASYWSNWITIIHTCVGGGLFARLSKTRRRQKYIENLESEQTDWQTNYILSVTSSWQIKLSTNLLFLFDVSWNFFTRWLMWISISMHSSTWAVPLAQILFTFQLLQRLQLMMTNEMSKSGKNWNFPMTNCHKATKYWSKRWKW